MSSFVRAPDRLRQDLASPAPGNGAALVAFQEPGIGGAALTVAAALASVINVRRFGAVGDGVTDDTAAVQAALAHAKLSFIKAVYFPAGSYVVTSTITLDAVGLTLFGDGAGGNSRSSNGSSGVVGTALNVGATQIIGDFNGGPVIRIEVQGCAVRDMTIGRSAAAYAAAYNTSDQGIRVSPPDVAGYRTTRQTTIKRVRIINQPGDGLLLANDVVSSVFDEIEVNCVKGQGFFIASGSWLGYVNQRQRSGIITFHNCVACWTGGHGFRAGGGASEVDINDIPYRISNTNFEAFYNCITPAVCVASPGIANCFLSGENHTFENCAFDGRVENPVEAVTHAAYSIRGNNITLSNCRFVQCTAPAGYVRAPAASGGGASRGIKFKSCYVVNSSGGAGYFNPVINYFDTIGIEVEFNQPDLASIAAVGALCSRRAGTLWKECFNGVGLEEATAQHVAGGVRSGFSLPDYVTLADDKAGYWEWDGITKGLLILTGNAAGAQSVQIAFRCGTSAYTAALGATSQVTATTGQLTGTTGVDGRLTVSADAATNRVYLENRLGVSYSWGAAFIACNTNAPGVGIVGAFVNLP